VSLPSRQQILDFLRDNPDQNSRREIARAFNVKGVERRDLRALLNDMSDAGELDLGRRKRVQPKGHLPAVTVIDVTGETEDGETLAAPVKWDGDGPPPEILVAPDGRAHDLERGARLLARLRRLDDGRYEARTIRRLPGERRTMLGILRRGPEGGRVEPTDKRDKDVVVVARDDLADAEDGELVRVHLLPGRTREGKRGKVAERVGQAAGPKAISLIAIQTHELPVEFAREAIEEAEAAKPVALGKRTDLRDVPLVTIDGADARDFDDAVWAEREGDGWHLVVAIADVAHYVRPGSALDADAYKRGNSAYFPDRVVPMLPEALSNDLCSLRPDEDRACMAAHLYLDAKGNLEKHRFVRGLMRSRARLTYEQVQAARDGEPDGTTKPLLDDVIAPLYGAYAALAAARRARHALEIDLPERKIELDDAGNVAAVVPRRRLDSHKLIEEFMITANVAAAQALEERRMPCMYRVHDQPDAAKLEALREVLEGFGFSLPKGQVVLPKTFNHILEKTKDSPAARMVNELVLRAQSQAEYSPDNIGHFGLALTRYAHFTSPIRRYADLMVHRSLIGGFGLGEGGLAREDGKRFGPIGEHISKTERTAQAAERDASDRYLAAFLADRVGETFEGAVNGVTRFGLFVTLDDTGADGLIPIRTLGADYYRHDEHAHALIGERTGERFVLGQRVEVKLKEADPMSGSLLLELMGAEDAGPAPKAQRRRLERGAASRKPRAKKTGRKGKRK